MIARSLGVVLLHRRRTDLLLGLRCLRQRLGAARAAGLRVRVGGVMGYAPGVYNMFHIGRLNILRNARDYLIAGVVEDDVVTRIKGRQLQYDVLCKGDEWKDADKETRLETLLGEVGARVHYFPYTAYISSADLRRLLEGMP